LTAANRSATLVGRSTQRLAIPNKVTLLVSVEIREMTVRRAIHA
jgi:hypothetical protein